MEQQNLRTYRRRSATRTSGYHVCDDSTGGECIILRAEEVVCDNTSISFYFSKEKLNLCELFGSGKSIIGFGGYVYSPVNCSITYKVSYDYNDKHEDIDIDSTNIAESKCWSNFGLFFEVILNKDSYIYNLKIEMNVVGEKSLFGLEFIALDLGTIEKDEFIDKTFEENFYQKTNMHVPYLFYLNMDKCLSEMIDNSDNYAFQKGQLVVLKSCNRCGRYLPINREDEVRTLSYSLHCKKNAPCKHSTFSSYTVKNLKDLSPKDKKELKIIDGKYKSYFGHQLECKACKKFFVNAPLNPQRNAQQFKEDGLRRRAIEILVNNLLQRNLVHFEFEEKNKREFTEYIWAKFNKKCFKCGPNSKDLDLNNHEVALDHTMPLAYLYRLDESATCLCNSHNSKKSDHFPVDFYTEDELKKLSKITGLSIERLHSREINQDVLNILVQNIVWFYDDFLMNDDYQKIRDGIRTSDKINDSLKRVIAGKVDLAEEYKKQTGHYPESVTIF